MYYLDGIIPCKLIPHEHVSDAYRLIELESGNRMEVPAFRIKNHRNQPTDSPSDILCPNCGKLSRYRTICEHCESPITSSVYTTQRINKIALNWLKRIL